MRGDGTSPGGKEGRRQKHTATLPYLPIYLKEITVNKLFTAVTSSRDSSPRLVIGRRARDHPGPVGGAPGDPRVGTAGGHMKVG